MSQRTIIGACGVVLAVGWGGSAAQAQQPGGEAGEPERRPAPATSESGEGPAVEGTVRTGLEYDTNARRTSAAEAQGDGLTRYFAALSGEVPGSEASRLSFRLRHGGKLFFDERASDALLTRVGLRYRHRLGGAAHGFFRAGVKDRQERGSEGEAASPRQDYNRGGAAVGVGARVGPVAGRIEAGWRYFAYRPNPASSSHGPRAGVSLSYDLMEELQLRARYGFSYRQFDAIRYVRRSVDGDQVVQRDRDEAMRDDRLHLVRVGPSYRGDFILSLDYLMIRNASNSYGQAMTRHGVEADATIPLVWRLYLSAKLSLQRTTYEDPLFVSADLQVDEENRNSAVASLTRVVGEHWEIEARYRLFIEEFGTASDYRRQTGFVGVGYVF